MKVAEIMSSSVACCTRDTPLRVVARLMCERDCGEIPIVEDLVSLRLVGVVTDRDITCRTVAMGKDPMQLSAKDCMSAPVVTVTPDTSLEDCCGLMELKQVRRMPVVDSNGGCRGIVSQADLALRANASVAAGVLTEVSRPPASSMSL